MRANIRNIRKRRIYSEGFKKQIVKEFESGKLNVLQLERLYGVTNPTIYAWIYKFSNFNDKGYRVIEMKDSIADKVKNLEKKINELERMVGMKQIKIDYLEKMIEVARDGFNMDIKKKLDTPQSGTSGKTSKN